MFEDPSNRSRLAKLIRFQTSALPESLTNLNDYVSRMKPKQEHIYYIAGATRAEVCILLLFFNRFVTILLVIKLIFRITLICRLKNLLSLKNCLRKVTKCCT